MVNYEMTNTLRRAIASAKQKKHSSEPLNDRMVLRAVLLEEAGFAWCIVSNANINPAGIEAKIISDRGVIFEEYLDLVANQAQACGRSRLTTADWLLAALSDKKHPLDELVGSIGYLSVFQVVMDLLSGEESPVHEVAGLMHLSCRDAVKFLKFLTRSSGPRMTFARVLELAEIGKKLLIFTERVRNGLSFR